jgi:hypothetical protein
VSNRTFGTWSLGKGATTVKGDSHPQREEGVVMKIFFVTLALLMAGLVFIAPPLIAVLPVLIVGVLLMASPVILNSMSRDKDRDGRTHDERPTSGVAAR